MAKNSKKPAKPKVDKAEQIEKKLELERIKNSREYPELAGLLAQDPYKKIATIDWINKHLPKSETQIVKLSAKEKDRFIVALIRTSKIQVVIDELRDLPTRKWKTLFAELASLPEVKATEKLKALKPGDLAALCIANGITPSISPKGIVSKPKTIPVVLRKLEQLGEYLKL